MLRCFDGLYLLIAILETSKFVATTSTCCRALFSRKRSEAILLITQCTISNRIIPTASWEPSSQLIHTESIRSTADLVLVAVARHTTATVGLHGRILSETATTVAFTYQGSAVGHARQAEELTGIFEASPSEAVLGTR
jgi:hypothetical protein